MELNTRGRYAVMAMADLAKFGGDDAVPLSAVAERQRLPLGYLEQIFLKLRRSGLVDSARGRSGGYRLARPAAAITVAEIMLAAEEETRLTRCAGEGYCAGDQPCLTHALWDELGRHITSYLSSVSLQQVVDGVPARTSVHAGGAPLIAGEAAA